jgi:hypothetical protein
VSLDGELGHVTLTLSGPADVWYGLALNASLMADEPYTLIVVSPLASAPVAEGPPECAQRL